MNKSSRNSLAHTNWECKLTTKPRVLTISFCHTVASYFSLLQKRCDNGMYGVGFIGYCFLRHLEIYQSIIFDFRLKISVSFWTVIWYNNQGYTGRYCWTNLIKKQMRNRYLLIGRYYNERYRKNCCCKKIGSADL